MDVRKWKQAVSSQFRVSVEINNKYDLLHKRKHNILTVAHKSSKDN